MPKCSGASFATARQLPDRMTENLAAVLSIRTFHLVKTAYISINQLICPEIVSGTLLADRCSPIYKHFKNYTENG
jgi:hypothetical protein